MDGFKQVPLAEFAKAHSPSRAMQVVTAGPAHGELAVLNVTPGPKLLVHGVERLQWDPKEGRAVGTLRGSGRGDGSVYVMAPHGWSFHRGEAGKERLRQEGGRAVEVPLERNARTSFDLEFRPD
jgi:hypothetical protein